MRGLEQNPETASRWAQLARQGKKVMQFLQGRRYIAVVVVVPTAIVAHVWIRKGQSAQAKNEGILEESFHP